MHVVLFRGLPCMEGAAIRLPSGSPADGGEDRGASAGGGGGVSWEIVDL